MIFIPIDKIKKLREDAKNGNPKAKQILSMQMEGQDFHTLLDEYFNLDLKQNKNLNYESDIEDNDIEDEKLKKFLEYNGVKKGDMDYESTIEAYYKEFPNKKNEQSKVIESKATDVEDENYSIYDEEDEIKNNVEETNEDKEKCFLDKLIEDEIEAINGYNSAIMEVMNLDSESESSRKGLIANLEEIKKDEIDHLDKLKRMKNSIIKKEYNEEIL